MTCQSPIDVVTPEAASIGGRETSLAPELPYEEHRTSTADDGGPVRHQHDRGRRAPAGLRTSPTGRVPQWVLDEAVGRVLPAEPWRGWEPAAPSGRRRTRTGIGVAVVVAAVVGLGAVAQHSGLLPRPAAAAVSVPTAGAEAADAPLGTPLTPPAGGGAHEFMALQDDGVTPVAYDPCRPVHYVIRPDNAPSGGDQLVQDAVARISEVTGLRFVYDGPTDEPPADHREPFQPDRYGDRWAPVLITWDTVAENADLAADTAGLGGSIPVRRRGDPSVFVTGAVALDAQQLTDVLARPGGAGVARAIVLHELGHVVGLGHVSDPTQLMYPQTSDVLDLGAGDLAGLAVLGSGECVPDL